MIIVYIDESGPITAGMISYCLERTNEIETPTIDDRIIHTPGPEYKTADHWPMMLPPLPQTDFGVEINATGQVQAIHFDIEIEEYHPELLYEPILPPEEPFCHSCRRRHNPNFCVRNGRSKRFTAHGRHYK